MENVIIATFLLAGLIFCAGFWLTLGAYPRLLKRMDEWQKANPCPIPEYWTNKSEDGK